jgi:hypothetical protein
MRAYKFLDSHFGLTALREKRLKQSHVEELNDPFELLPCDLTDPAIRNTFLQTRENINKARVVVCFSEHWCDPVIWAHYSDKHRGLCLGFEIPNPKGEVEDESGPVRYIEKPLHFPADFSELGDTERFEITRNILFTKFINWKYEHEIRLWAELKQEENGLHFRKFDDDLRIVEVIVGEKSKLNRSEIVEALGALATGVKIIKARAAYDKFEMVEDEGWN